MLNEFDGSDIDRNVDVDIRRLAIVKILQAHEDVKSRAEDDHVTQYHNRLETF